MNQNAPATEEAETRPQLKYPEPEISRDNLWQDDCLGRGAMASTLTGLVQHQTYSLTVSLDGGWGTGKTFFLKRWQKQLQAEGFHAIYFNAWEDDFHADPLVAIVGQLVEFADQKNMVEHAKEDIREIIKQIKEEAETIPSLYNMTRKILGTFVGTELPPVDFSCQESPFDKYEKQTESKRVFREKLQALAKISGEKTDKPLIFVIDELDRCRPTFAIELLERVKHLFDVDGLVFVFGINREELSKSIQSIYGEIEVDIYLRKFFDVNFLLSEVDLESYCRHLLSQYELQEFFTASDLGHKEASGFAHGFSFISKHLELSLRDVDHCIRTLAVFGRAFSGISHTQNVAPKRLSPLGRYMLITLILLRVKAPKLYRSIVGKVSRNQIVGVEIATQVAQWRINDEALDEETLFLFDFMELSAYAVCTDRNNSQRNPPLAYLSSLDRNALASVSEYLPESTRNNLKRQERLSKYIECDGQLGLHRITSQLVPTLINRMELVDLPR